MGRFVFGPWQQTPQEKQVAKPEMLQGIILVANMKFKQVFF